MEPALQSEAHTRVLTDYVFTFVVVISHGNISIIAFAMTPPVTIELTAETETEHNKKLDSRAFMSRP